MNGRLISWLSLLVLLLAACQPVRPEGASTTPPTAASSDATTSTGVITDSTEITATTESSATASTPRTATIPSSDSTVEDEAASCPDIADNELDISVLANWVEDEQRHYRIHKNRIDSVDGEESIVLSVTTPLTITVISDDGEGYVLEWEYGPTELGESELEVTDPLAMILQSPLEILVTYATDEAGSYVELQNIEQLQAQLTPLFDKIFDAILESDETLDPAMMETARSTVDQIISDPANFETLFTQEVQLFHTLFDFYFDSTEPLVLSDLRPNMLGGAPIPSELTIMPTQYDADLGCLHVAFENIADPVVTRNSVLESLQEQARQLGVEPPTEADLPEELELIDNIRIEMDLDEGWPTNITSERAITFGNRGRIETTEIVVDE